MTDVGAELRAKYGKPEYIGKRGPNTYAWRHASEESARAFAAANGEDGAVLHEDGHWLSTVDLARRLAEIEAMFRATYTVPI
jgi:hypothetical protein